MSILRSIADLLAQYKFSKFLLERFNILSILIGAISFFRFAIFLAPLSLLLGIIAKNENQKAAIFGIILGVIGLFSFFILLALLLLEDVQTGNYEAIIEGFKGMIIIIALGAMETVRRRKS